MRIVLVEQSRVGVMILCAMLGDSGHEVIAFRDGGEALAFIQADETVDVLITSLEVPTVSGFQLCWEARLLIEQSRALYVIAMSSTYDGRSLRKALDSGADDFIMKPPDKQQLQARLRAAERMLAAQRKLIALANHDPLTNLLNRRAFMERAQAAHERTVGAKGAAMALIVDIDHFKRVNDTYGHDIGDDVIRHMGVLIDRCGAIGGRLGGEEFAIFLENCGRVEGLAVAEALRADVAKSEFTTQSDVMQVTVSIGLAELLVGDSLRTLLKRADQALYAAKDGGRNRVVVSSAVTCLQDVA